MFSSSPSLSDYVVALPHSQRKTSPRRACFFALSEVYRRLALKTFRHRHHWTRIFLNFSCIPTSLQFLLFSTSQILSFRFSPLLWTHSTISSPIVSLTGVARSEHKPLFFQACGVSVVILRLLIESQPHQSWVVNINVSCLIFTIPPRGGGGAPDRAADEKEQTWKRQQTAVVYFYSYKHANVFSVRISPVLFLL